MFYYIHADQLGRPEEITNGNQSAVWIGRNFVFDRSILQEGIPGIDIGFPGQVYDAETGHWHNGFRDYDPSNGEYIESDPIGLSGGVNTYAYVGGEPLSHIDPLGLDDTQCMFSPAACGMSSPSSSADCGCRTSSASKGNNPNMTANMGTGASIGIVGGFAVGALVVANENNDPFP